MHRIAEFPESDGVSTLRKRARIRIVLRRQGEVARPEALAGPSGVRGHDQPALEGPAHAAVKQSVHAGVGRRHPAVVWRSHSTEDQPQSPRRICHPLKVLMRVERPFGKAGQVLRPDPFEAAVALKTGACASAQFIHESASQA